MTYIAIPTKVALLVRVVVDEKDDLFSATSPDLNIFVSGHSIGEEFQGAIKKAIKENLTAMGQEPSVAVIRANHPERNSGYWHFVAIPQNMVEELN